MDTDYMEKLAKAYNAELNRCTAGNGSLLGAAADMVESQLDIINCLLHNSRPCNKALLYLESVKRCSLTALRALCGASSVPEYRERSRTQSNYFNRLVDLQIELMAALDRLEKEGEKINPVLEIENRALSVIAVIR